MKKLLLFLIAAACSTLVWGQAKMYIHKTEKVTIETTTTETDSVYFTDKGANVYFKIGDKTLKYNVTEIDSISFDDLVTDNTVRIVYNGSTVTITNPLQSQGVLVTNSGTDVLISSAATLRDIKYDVSGSTSDGSLKIYSEKRYNLILNGLNITNLDGPAINIQSNNKVFVTLMDGTTNYVADGGTYADSIIVNNEAEDLKAAFFSEGQMIFNGAGSLTIAGKGNKHALCSDDYIEITNGTINITSAAKDGIHAKDGVKISGGTTSISSSSDGIDGANGQVYISGGTLTITNTAIDSKAIASDSLVVMAGGAVSISVAGNQSKGVSGKMGVLLAGGTLDIKTSGGVGLVAKASGFDPAYCTAIKSDGYISISGAKITVECTGAGAKGLSSDQSVMVTAGSLSVKNAGVGTTYTDSTGTIDAYSSSCITADGAISLEGGTITLTATGAGGKGIAGKSSIVIGSQSSSPTISISTTGAKFAVSTSTSTSTGGGPGRPGGQSSSTDYCHPKAIVADGTITINSGAILIASSDDGIHSETAYTQNGGEVTITNSYEGIESLLMTFNGGTAHVTASNDGLNGTQGTVSGGTESTDASYIYFNGGRVVATCTGGDAIDCNGNIVMNSGTVVANGPSSGVEEGADFNGSFSMNGGLLIAAGSNSNMTKALSNTSTQYNLFISSSAMIANTSLLNIQDANGNSLISFQPSQGGYKFLFSSSELKNGATYSIYTGGTYTGGSATDGIYTGGSYSGGTLKKSVTLSGSVTSVSF